MKATKKKRGKKSTWTKAHIRLIKKYLKLGEQRTAIRKEIERTHSLASIVTMTSAIKRNK